MAIVNCPSCNKPISSRTTLCPYCGFQRGEASEEQLREFRRRKLRDRVYHLKMLSYAALTLLLVAFGWYLAESSGLQSAPSAGPYASFTIGAACYLVVRVFLYRARASLRKLGL